MEWIDLYTGIPPQAESELILVIREDGTYDIGYKVNDLKYIDRLGKDIKEGSFIKAFLNVPVFIKDYDPICNCLVYGRCIEH